MRDPRRGVVVSSLDAARVAGAKRAFSTRRVPPKDMHMLISGAVRPSSGDLVLARVEAIGKQKRLELTDGRRAHMFPGDDIIVSYGNRYAPDQFEAIIGDDLSGCDLVAAGGIASRELSRHDRMIAPTRIAPAGLIADESGRRLNLRDYAIPRHDSVGPITTVFVVGTSMNAGKTLTSASLVRGLKMGGHRVAAIKVTGTGAGGDMWIMRDVGADVVLDFTDAGFASTYMTALDELEDATTRLIGYAANAGCHFAIIEIADGLQQQETAALLHSDSLRCHSSGVVFAAYDAMGAKSGVEMLQRIGHRVFAVSGKLARSPLMIREAEMATGLPVLTPWELMDGALVPTIVGERQFARPRQTSLDTPAAGSAKSSRRSRSAALQSSLNSWYRAQKNGKTFPGSRNGSGSRHLGHAATAAEGSGPFENKGDAAGVDVVRDLLRLVGDEMMEFDVDAICGAKWGERSTDRINRRNGYRDRLWQTPAGTITLRTPRLRSGGYRPAFLDLKPRSEKALSAVVLEASTQNISAGAVRRLLTAMGATSVSKKRLSRFRAVVAAWADDLRKTKAANTTPSVAAAFDLAALDGNQGESDSVRPSSPRDRVRANGNVTGYALDEVIDIDEDLDDDFDDDIEAMMPSQAGRGIVRRDGVTRKSDDAGADGARGVGKAG